MPTTLRLEKLSVVPALVAAPRPRCREHPQYNRPILFRHGREHGRSSKNRLPKSQRKSDLGIPLPYTWLNPSTRPSTFVSDRARLASVSTKLLQAQFPMSKGVRLIGVFAVFAISCFEGAFTALARDKVYALVVGTDPFFYSQRVQLVTLAMRHALPTVYNVREYAEAGGLMSYGTSLTEALRQMGAYTARILKGEKPIDLSVLSASRLEPLVPFPFAPERGGPCYNKPMRCPSEGRQ